MDLCTFFLVIAVLSEYYAGSPISLTLWHLYKGGTSPQIFVNLSSCDQACVNAAN